MAQEDKENEQPKTGEENEQGQQQHACIHTRAHTRTHICARAHTHTHTPYCHGTCEFKCYILSGSFTFKLNSRKHTIELTARTEESGIKWVNAIQEVRSFLLFP